MKKILRKHFVISLLIIFIVYGCKPKQKEITSDETIAPTLPLFGLATGLGGLNDNAYNDLLYKGMILSKQAFNIDFIYGSPENEHDSKNAIQKLIDRGALYIIAGGGYHMVEPVDELARIHPNILFTIIDFEPKEYLPNISSIMFKQNEGSYLVGALSALQSKTKTIGVIGAINNEIIQDFVLGFEAGAKKINPKINIIKEYIADHDNEVNPFNNPKTAYSIANRMYRKDNVDIIYQISAGSGLGVFNSARDNNTLAIGTDSDQDHLVPNSILTSMIKRIDLSVKMMIQLILEDNFENKVYWLGLNDDYVSLSPMTYTKDLITINSLDEVNKLKQQIIEKKIIVPSAFNY